MAQSRRYFGTDGVRGVVGVAPITADFVLKLGWAAGQVLAAWGHGKVLIGKDTRISGYMFESALEAGLSSAGIDILLLGPMPTPAVAYLTRTFRANAGIVISGSHNAYSDNGIKFFSRDGRKLADEIELAIEAKLDENISTVASSRLGKAERVVDAPGRYIEFCKATVPGRLSLRGLKVVVDCAHGATYHVAPSVLEEMGAELVVIGDRPDGLNINAGCGSTAPRALQEAVLQERADLGIAFDGDGDRVILVDHMGEIADGDDVLYVIAGSRRRMGVLHGSVVGTVMSNLGLELALQARAIGFERTPVGDRHILERLDQQNWTLGGETSGHIICHDRTTTGDGIVSALQVLAEMVDTESSLQALKAGLQKYPQQLVNVTVDRALELDGSAQVQAAVREVEHQLGRRGRVLLRPSGTEPVVRVMVEGEEEAQVRRLAQELADAVRQAASL